MQAATTAVSQNVGAQEYERSRSVARWSMVLVVVLTGILTVPAVVFRRQVLGLYTSSGAELEAAFTRMMIVCLTYSLDGTMAAMSGVNRGLGYSMLSAAVTFVGACVFRIIWVYTVFASVGTLESLYVSYPISWILSTAAHIVCYYIIRKKAVQGDARSKSRRGLISPSSQRKRPAPPVFREAPVLRVLHYQAAGRGMVVMPGTSPVAAST